MLENFIFRQLYDFKTYANGGGVRAYYCGYNCFIGGVSSDYCIVTSISTLSTIGAHDHNARLCWRHYGSWTATGERGGVRRLLKK
jgi:hypothetical protein